MTDGMAKYWIIPRVGDKELPRVGHLTGLLQSPHFLCSYQSFWKDEQLGELCADCLCPGSNSDQRIHSQTC